MIKRREFIKLATTATMLVGSGHFVAADEANFDVIAYKPGIVKQALADGKTVFIDYATHWCTTCKSQERTIRSLRKENPKYNDLLFVRVDWDEDSSSPISTDYNIPRRSTLLVLKGDRELGRIVAGTGRGQIKELLDAGLTAENS